jgi:hypothetical protein
VKPDCRTARGCRDIGEAAHDAGVVDAIPLLLIPQRGEWLDLVGDLGVLTGDIEAASMCDDGQRRRGDDDETFDWMLHDIPPSNRVGDSRPALRRARKRILGISIDTGLQEISVGDPQSAQNYQHLWV